jgi:hypothetical protein
MIAHRLIALLAGCAVFAAAAQRAENDLLKPYISCKFEDGLHVTSSVRLPEGTLTRMVTTGSGRKTVSTIDGYRMLLAYPGKEPFLNLRVEESASDRYQEDKKTIVDQMSYIAGVSTGAVVPVGHDTYGSLDHYRLDDLTINHQPIAMHSLFDDKRRVVITVYFLNAPPEKRSYATMDQFRALRDRFFTRYFACVRENGG